MNLIWWYFVVFAAANRAHMVKNFYPMKPGMFKKLIQERDNSIPAILLKLDLDLFVVFPFAHFLELDLSK